MPRAKMKTQEEWARLEMQMRSSGMTQKAWCEAYGINSATMRNSIKRRKKSAIETVSPKETGTTVNWIEAEAIVSKNTSNVAFDDIRVMAGRYVINVPVGFDRVTFIDICRALSAL
jgi:transposase-like protein